MITRIVAALFLACACASSGPAGAPGQMGPPGERGPAGEIGPTAIVHVALVDGGTVTFDGGLLVVTGPPGPPGSISGTVSSDVTFSGNVNVQGDVTVNGRFVAGFGRGASNPATSCAALHVAEASLPSGVYWLKPATARVAFQAYCDMVTDGGGWTLVWSNLRGGRGKPATELQFVQAVLTLPRFGQTAISSDLESFNVYTGIGHFNALAPSGLLRYDWAKDFGQPVQQQQICPFSINASNQYSISFTNASCRQLIGSVPSQFFVFHNGHQFSAYDRDNDTTPDSNCSHTVSNTPFWYSGCADGSIWGNGEAGATTYHYNGAYWVGSNSYWGTDAGRGAGNGWFFVK